MGGAMGDEHGVPCRQREAGSILHPKHGVADCNEMEPGMARLGRETQAEIRSGLDAAVLDAAQTHATQQLVNEIGRKGNGIGHGHSGVSVKR